MTSVEGVDISPQVCEVCQAEPVFGVACIPGVPYSAAYGVNCLRAGAHPWSILVSNTACIGGWEQSGDWWKQMCADTWTHLGRTAEEFLAEVEKELEELKHDYS